MKLWQFYLIMMAIYSAPQTSKKWRDIAMGSFAGLAITAIAFGGWR